MPFQNISATNDPLPFCKPPYLMSDWLMRTCSMAKTRLGNYSRRPASPKH